MLQVVNAFKNNVKVGDLEVKIQIEARDLLRIDDSFENFNQEDTVDKYIQPDEIVRNKRIKFIIYHS